MQTSASEYTDSGGTYEKLFLLRNIGTLAYYYRPKLEPTFKNREDFGFDEKSHIYLCPQTLFKIHPDFDGIIAGILRKDELGEVVLIESATSLSWGELLRKRFKNTIPDVFERIKFLPAMNQSDFLSLIAASDLMLDTIYFNGMNTSLEALAVGTPVVTMPTDLQRGRHTYGMYTRMGLDDCICWSPEQYVNLSVELCCNESLLRRVKERISLRSHVLFEDLEVVREFERFFEEAYGKVLNTV